MNEEKLMVSLLMKKYFRGEQDIKEALEESFSKVDEMDAFTDETDKFFSRICNLQTKLIILSNIMLSQKTLDNKNDYKYIIKKLEEVTKKLKKCYEEEMGNECK